jgi:hypothetical protein
MYVNNTKGRHCCFSMATRFTRTHLNIKLCVHCLFCSFEASFVCVSVRVSAESVRYWFSLVVYCTRGLDVAPSITLSRCGNCNHALCWRPSTSIIYICLSRRTGSCTARTIPSDTIATFAGSPRCIGSPTACVHRTIQHIVSVCKNNQRDEMFPCRLSKATNFVYRNFYSLLPWNNSKTRQTTITKHNIQHHVEN